MPGVHIGEVLLSDRTVRAVGVYFAPHERSSSLAHTIPFILDTLTGLHGPKTPEIGASGWLVRPLAGGVQDVEVANILPGAHHHPPIAYTELVQTVGGDALQGFMPSNSSSEAQAA